MNYPPIGTFAVASGDRSAVVVLCEGHRDAASELIIGQMPDLPIKDCDGCLQQTKRMNDKASLTSLRGH